MPKITAHAGPSDSAAAVTYPVGVLPAAEPQEVPEAPPLTGAGSGRAAWADYAETLGHDPSGLSKADLVELVG